MSNNGLIWSPTEFTQAAAQALAVQPQVEIVDVSDLTLVLRIGGRAVTSDLHHFYQVYRNAPDQFGAIQEALIAALIDLPPDRTETDPVMLLDRIFPMLKPLALLHEVRTQGLPLLAYRPFVGDLMVAYVVDEGQSVAFVNEDHLRHWNVAEPVLYQRAVQNLRARPWQPHPGQLGSGKAGILIFNGRDGYDATRVLLPELLTAFAAQVPGNLVIGVPNRDFLIAFSDAEPSVFNRVRQQIEIDARTQAHPLSTQLLTLRDGQIALYAA